MDLVVGPTGGQWLDGRSMIDELMVVADSERTNDTNKQLYLYHIYRNVPDHMVYSGLSIARMCL